MSDFSSVIAAVVVPVAIVTPIVLRVVFRHQREMAMIYAQAANPQVASDVQELKQQVADMRELMIDMALQPSTAAMQERLKVDR